MKPWLEKAIGFGLILTIIFGGFMLNKCIDDKFYGKPQTSTELQSDEHAITFNPVCRHKAIYWASMIGEDYQVRIAYGKLHEWHVQPQIKILNTWYYFKVEDDQVVIITMPKSWRVHFYVSWVEYAIYHNVWIKRLDNGKTWRDSDWEEYNKRLNTAIKVLREGVPDGL